MNKNKKFGYCSATAVAITLSVVVVAKPASAGWLENLIKPVAFEEIPAPESLNAPIQEDHSIMVESVPQAQPMPMTYETHPSHEVYSPIYPPAPMHHHGAHAMCCKQPHVSYRNHPVLAMLMHKCKTGHAGQVVVEVPTGCCPAQVTVCVPLCCLDCVPQMNKRHDLLGRCIFQYCWPCGTKINIVQRFTGDLIVHSYEL